jgi:hypothetical protein
MLFKFVPLMMEFTDGGTLWSVKDEMGHSGDLMMGHSGLPPPVKDLLSGLQSLHFKTKFKS